MRIAPTRSLFTMSRMRTVNDIDALIALRKALRRKLVAQSASRAIHRNIGEEREQSRMRVWVLPGPASHCEIAADRLKARIK